MSTKVDIDKAASNLEQAVRDLYEKETAEDAARWGEETVPDFRDYNGMRLQKFGILIDCRCACSACLRQYATEVVDRLLSFERGLIRGAGGSGDCEEVTRHFLKDHELPAVFPVVPPHLRRTPKDIETAKIPAEALGQLRVRHVFGVQHP